MYRFSRHFRYKPVIALLHSVLSSSFFLPFTGFRHKGAKAHCSSDSPQVGLSEWGLQWAATKSQNQLVIICMYTLKEKPMKRAMLQFTSSQLLKRIPQAQNGITCAKAYATKPKLSIWPNCSLDLHQKCNLNQPEGIFWSTPMRSSVTWALLHPS